MKRRGVSLIEVIAVLPLLATASLVFTMLFSTLILEVPRQQKAAQIGAGLSSMLHRMRRDVEVARSLPDTHAGLTASEKLLLMELPDGVVCYRPVGCGLVRSDVSAGTEVGARSGEDESAPRAKVSFRRWRRGGQAYAVEVHTAVEFAVKGQPESRLVNSHVLFLSSLPDRRETP